MILLKNNNYYMSKALKLAKKAMLLQEIPVGAVIVCPENKIIGQGFNQVIKKKSQNMHAEIIAINKACKKLGDWRLNNCTLYVTLQPCAMCFSLAGLSRIKTIVYGAKSPLFGTYIDNNILPDLYKKHVKKIISGIMEPESSALLKEFFKIKRNNK